MVEKSVLARVQLFQFLYLRPQSSIKLRHLGLVGLFLFSLRLHLIT